MPWKNVISRVDLKTGYVMAFSIEGTKVAVYNVDGEFYATHNICTHAYACLSDGYLDGVEIECPMHQGVFDVRTGKALRGPVDTDLRTFPLRVSDGIVQIDLAESAP